MDPRTNRRVGSRLGRLVGERGIHEEHHVYNCKRTPLCAVRGTGSPPMGPANWTVSWRKRARGIRDKSDAEKTMTAAGDSSGRQATVYVFDLAPGGTRVVTLGPDGQVVREEVVDCFPAAGPWRGSRQPFLSCPSRDVVHAPAANAQTPRDHSAYHQHGTPRSPFLSLREAAGYVRSRKTRIMDWVRRGLLRQATDPDGRRFFRVSHLDEVMTRGPVAKEPVAPATVSRALVPSTQKTWLRPVQPRTKPRDPTERR
jgi:hypothetical protein